MHLWNNLAAFRGAAAWERAVTQYDHPVAFFFSSVLALLPLGLHTVWGIGRLFTARPNNGKYLYFQNVKYALQRLSAIGVLLFLGAHIYKAMLEPRLAHGRAETFADIAHQMHHHLPTLLVYRIATVLKALVLGAFLGSIGWVAWGTGQAALLGARGLQALAFALAGFLAALLVLGLLGETKRPAARR